MHAPRALLIFARNVRQSPKSTETGLVHSKVTSRPTLNTILAFLLDPALEMGNLAELERGDAVRACLIPANSLTSRIKKSYLPATIMMRMLPSIYVIPDAPDAPTNRLAARQTTRIDAKEAFICPGPLQECAPAQNFRHIAFFGWSWTFQDTVWK